MTIDSVLRQTYRNWEMIIVDDASTDNTCTIIYDYCKKDNRIKLIRLKTDHVTESMKKAIGETRRRRDKQMAYNQASVDRKSVV